MTIQASVTPRRRARRARGARGRDAVGFETHGTRSERRAPERHSRNKVRPRSRSPCIDNPRMPPAPSSRADAEPRWPGQLAAIDMGSNSFRLEIGQIAGGRYRRIDYLKETVRLGAGLDAAGFLERRRRGARPRLPGPLRAPARRLPAVAGARRRDPDAARGEEPRRVPAARAGRARPADRDHLGPRGGAPHLRRRRAPAAVDRAAPGRRHRRPLDRDDRRPRHAAARGPSRSRSAASACR